MATTEPRRRTRRHVRGERSREEILDAASQLMSARGYSGTSISDLAKESGLPASSIYWHFASKAGVLGAVMERGAERYFSAVTRADLPLDVAPEEALRAVMEHSALAVGGHPEFLRLFMLLLLGSEGDAAQADVVARVRAEGRARLHTGIRHAYAPWGTPLAATIADELADVATALFDGIFIASQVGEPPDMARLVGQMVDSLHALAGAVAARREVAAG